MSIYTKKYHPLTHTIGKRVAQIRKAQGIGQEDLASKTKHTLSFNTISVLERGLGDPKISTLYEIASVLKISLSDLLDIENPEIKKQPEFLQNLEKGTQLLKKMTPEQLKTAIKLLEVL